MNSTYSLAVLVIASDFPPLAGTNTQRVQSFARYLPKYGWQPSIITRSIEDMSLIDTSQLLRMPEDLEVFRVHDPDVFAWLRRRSGQVAKNVQGATRLVTEHPTCEVSQEAGNQIHKAILRAGLRVASNVVMMFRRYFAYLPDALSPWARASAKVAMKICLERGCKVVFASAPSYSCLMAGLYVARKCGLPFFADFRDLWVGRPYRPVHSRWHDWWDRRFERQVALRADKIILASPAWVRHFRELYGDRVADKCVTITNGYDHSLLPKGQSQTVGDESITTFVNTGAMYGSESPAPFLEALGRVLDRNRDWCAKVRVRLIGYAGDEEPKLRGIVNQWQLEGTVKFLGPQPHASCLLEQARADVLLLFSGMGHEETIRGKSFEYMATGKRILALIPSEGIQAELLRQAGTATIVDHGDVEKTENALENLLKTPQNLTTEPNWKYIRGFEREALTYKLAGVLDELVAR